ncbi:MAG: ABC transporter ATP-binding protein [Desulfobacter sp.]|nr:ABC transporter ATP-binding protein [Desulfobacter sp.]WDP84245.1 MAG: ABC transporter ATP-binding protein [Desulfobacter sp.]
MNINIQNTWFSFGQTPILKDINCEFSQPGFHAILGPNGSGKTTLLDLISGFLQPDQGSILLDRTPISQLSKNKQAKSMALVSQNYAVNFPFTVNQVVLMGRHPYLNRFSHPTNKDLNFADKIMSHTGILHLKHRKMTELSGGEKQRCIFARALCQDTPILLLDEAFSNMDICHTLHLLRLLKKEVVSRKKTIIAVLHDLNLAAAWSDRLIFLKAGRIISMGSTDQVFTRDNIQTVFNVDTKVKYNDYSQARQAYFKAS